jgi:rifampicin phosphotransferase
MRLQHLSLIVAGTQVTCAAVSAIIAQRVGSTLVTDRTGTPKTILISDSLLSEVESRAGGKGHNIYRLSAAGIMTPPWAVLGADMFDEFRTPLDGDIAQLLAGVRPANADQVARDIETMIMTAEMSVSQVEIIRRAYEMVEGGVVAVRSSAKAEDSRGHSFAGQFATFLGVLGIEQVIESVQRCWASFYSARSLLYRLQHGLEFDDARMAVIIQRLVHADSSGVIFTCNPAEARPEMMIGAVYGLGEGLVSGAVDSDTVVVSRTDQTVSRYTTGEKLRRFDYSDATGLIDRPVADDLRSARVLADADVAMLAQAAEDIEALFGEPQDIEWAIAKGRLWILQARPITTAAEAASDARPEDYRIWDNSNIIESYNDVTTQLTFTFARHLYHQVYREFVRLLHIPEEQREEMDSWLADMLGNFNGRVYYNLINWYRVLRVLPFYRMNRAVFEVSLGVQQRLSDEEVGRLVPAPYSCTSRLTEWRLRARTTFRFALRYLTSHRDVLRFLKHFYSVFYEFESIDYDALSSPSIYRYYCALERKLLRSWGAMVILESVIGMSLGALTGLTRRWLPDAPSWFLWAVASPGTGIESIAPVRALDNLVRLAREDPEIERVILETPHDQARSELEVLGREAFLGGVDDYVRHFGYRTLDELKLEEPDLSDNPSAFFVMLADALRRPQTADGAAVGMGSAEADAVLARELNLIQRWIFGLVRRKVQRGLADREQVRFCRTRSFGIARRMFLAIGRDLAQSGAIPSARDVFHLRLEELRGCFSGTIAHHELGSLTELRNRAFEADKRLVGPGRFVTQGLIYWHGNLERAGWGAVTEGNLVAGAPQWTVLHGIPSSPGIGEGQARVAREPWEASGGILVTYRTDPGWAALLPGIAGLVIERGSPLTHVAIVARELGIPTVVQVPDVTRIVRTGQRLRVNGYDGTVTVLADTSHSDRTSQSTS